GALARVGVGLGVALRIGRLLVTVSIVVGSRGRDCGRGGLGGVVGLLLLAGLGPLVRPAGGLSGVLGLFLLAGLSPLFCALAAVAGALPDSAPAVAAPPNRAINTASPVAASLAFNDIFSLRTMIEMWRRGHRPSPTSAIAWGGLGVTEREYSGFPRADWVIMAA